MEKEKEPASFFGCLGTLVGGYRTPPYGSTPYASVWFHGLGRPYAAVWFHAVRRRMVPRWCSTPYAAVWFHVGRGVPWNIGGPFGVELNGG